MQLILKRRNEMYYVLMHKDSPIAFCKDEKIIKVLNKDMLPIGTVCEKKKYDLKQWLKQRQIPKIRTGYSEIKETLKKNSISIDEYYYKNNGVSLIDCYWFYPVPNSLYFSLINNLKNKSKSKINTKINAKVKEKIPKYDSIKVYSKNNNNYGLLQALAEKKEITENIINSTFPDNVTSGATFKYWVCRNSNYFLVKQNHPSNNVVAEKIIASQILCDIINKTRRTINDKKEDIKTASYIYETGKTPIESCCYAKCFTDELQGLTTYAMIETSVGKEMKMEEMLEYINPSSVDLKEYFDFIILFDYLTENERTKDDIGFTIRNDFNRPIGPAPLHSFSNTFNYMNKDYERIYKKDNMGNYVNVFGMSIEEQIDYIVKIEWIDNRELFRNIDELKEYFETDADNRQLSLSNLETICNVINHKLYHIENRKYEIAEEEGLLEEYGFEYREDEYYDEEDEDDEEDSNYYRKHSY
jgi:hypothetical protein